MAEQTTTATIDEQLSEKRAQLTQAQITQTDSYALYLKVLKAKAIVPETETDKLEKLDKLLYQHFISYQHALEESQKLQVEVSELESQKFLEELLAE